MKRNMSPIEFKHSNKVVEKQYRHLINNEKCNLTEQKVAFRVESFSQNMNQLFDQPVLFR